MYVRRFTVLRPADAGVLFGQLAAIHDDGLLNCQIVASQIVASQIVASQIVASQAGGG